jgi:hypothetical protein
MNPSSVPAEATYDWGNLRKWCICYLRAFLQHAAELDTKQGWAKYQDAQRRLPLLAWKKLRRIPDERVRFIMEVVVSNIDEASDKKVALPGMFSDAVRGAKEMLVALEQHDDLDVIKKEIGRIDDAM